MTITVIEPSANFLGQLFNPALRALMLAAAGGLGLAAFRVKSTSARLFTWTIVLYVALAMPWLGWLLPPLSVSIPTFLQHAPAPPSRPVKPLVSGGLSLARAGSVVAGTAANGFPSETANSSFRVSQRRNALPVQPPAAMSSASQGASFWSSIRWSTVATWLYFTVALFLLGRLLLGFVFGRRLVQASQEICDPRVTVRVASRAHASGLSLIPQVAESECISVPVTLGVLQSRILLPPGWREWDDAKLDVVLAHELSHVARHDAMTQHLSLMHRAIFWFSPLSWWLNRHLAELAEQASDEVVLSCGADRNHYARTLLGFCEALQAASGRVWWQGVAMAKAGQAERRLARILAWRGAATMGLSTSSLKKSLAIAIIVLAIPVVYLAASIRAAGSNAGAQEPAPPPPATARPSPAPPSQPNLAPGPPGVTPSPREPAPPSSDALPEPVLAPPAPGSARFALRGPHLLIGPIAPVASVPPVPSSPGVGPSSRHRGYSYAYGDDDEQRFVIVSGKSDSYTMSGSTEDVRHVEKLKKQISGDFIWFQRDEKSYIIRDQETIERARKLWAPEEELGRKQEELGKQQEALGKQQEALGAKMEQVRVKVPDMTAELDNLKAELKALSSGATMTDVGRIQSKIGELQSKIGELQSRAGEEQSKLGEEMSALGEKQGALGERQGDLGRQQGELAEKASRQMKELLDEAIKNGTAKPELETSSGASL